MFIGSVLDALVRRAEDPQEYVNFRDHPLTLVLEPTLNGESFSILMLCFPNLKKQSVENVKTIRFGLRALKLPLLPKQNKVDQTMDLTETIIEQQTLSDGAAVEPPSDQDIRQR